MASTHKTDNLKLSQFVATDKPAWLTDYNNDMLKMDEAVSGAVELADGRVALYDPPEEGQEKGPVALAGGIPNYVGKAIRGVGGGDMASSLYDPDGEISAMGGISAALEGKANSSDLLVFHDDVERRLPNEWYMTGMNESSERLYKPLYRNYFYLNGFPNNATTFYDPNVPNMDASTFRIVPTTVVRYAGSTSDTEKTNGLEGNLRVTARDGKIRVVSTSDRRTTTAEIWFTYTKTTDAAFTEAEIRVGSHA